MRALAFLWRGVLAFDRIGSRIPQLVQMWLIEFFFVIPLSFFIAKIIDVRGAFGVPGTGGPIGGVFWGALVVSLVCGTVFVRGLVRPRIVHGSWTPVVRADVGDVTVFGGNRSWTVSYDYLTSHPSYALMLGITVWVPLVMVWMNMNQGGSTFYWRVAGAAGLVIIVLMVLARLLAWYVFRFGRAELDGVTGRSAWEIAWKPVLMLVVLMYGIVWIPLGFMWWRELRTIAALPEVAASDADRTDEFFRLEGPTAGEPVFWAPRGTGRGGDNYSGAGILVTLESGGDALLLAESMSVADFIGVLEDRTDGVVHTHGRVIDGITDDQQTYYGFDLDDFGPPQGGGRVLMLLQYP